jgi:glucose/arabinose dehydrogenase
MHSPRNLLLTLIFASPALLAGGVPADVTLETAFGGATFSTPVALRHAGDGSGRKFVVERSGRIRVVDSGGSVLAAAFLDDGDGDFADPVSTAGEGGLLGLAFHPDYASNGRFYVYYTWDNGTGLISRISEFTVSADPNIADPASERVILEVPQDFSNHNGGDIHFGPDGYLWIGFGDGGSGNDPCNRGQTLDPADLLDCGSHPTTPAKALLGKMVRIDVDNTTSAGDNDLCAADGDGAAAYAIPADNPFGTSSAVVFSDRFETVLEACPEVWAYGMRNPYRFSFDRDTGDLWIGDVGQNTWEEINHELAADPGGNNYGWKICEGSFERGSDSTACPLADHFGPIHDYSNTGCGSGGNGSVTGGFRYRGPVTSLQGTYVFGDFCSGRVWFMTDIGGSFTVDEFTNIGNIYGFGEDEAGELYVLLGDQIRVFDGNR